MAARAHRIHVMRFHLPARDHVVMDWAPALYVIRVDGHLGAMTLSAFPGMTPQQRGTHNGVHRLAGPVSTVRRAR